MEQNLVGVKQMISSYKGRDLKIRFEPNPFITAKESPVYSWSVTWHHSGIPRGIFCRGTLSQAISGAKNFIDNS